MPSIKNTGILFFLTGIFLLLQSCMSLATTGAQVVYNRHSIERNIRDQLIAIQAYQALYVDSSAFKDTNIVISAYHGEVLLTGQAPNAWQIAQAEAIVKKIRHVKAVYNVVSLKNPSSLLTRVSDMWITAKIKSKLIVSNDVDVTQVKVVTENGTVYLMGVLSPQHAQIAANIASETAGVLKVVKMFSYMMISKTAQSS